MTRLFASIKLSWKLRKRRAIRLAEGERVRAGQLAARRKAWARDPLRVQA